MKVAPVERTGGWRPSGGDARALASNRLQSVSSDTAAPAPPQASVSGRELPVVAVKRGANAELRPVLQSDAPKGIDAPLPAFEATGAPLLQATSTVDVFSKGVRIPAQTDASTGVPLVDVTAHTAAPSTAKARATAAVDAASVHAKQQAEQQKAAEAAAAANEPPKEPMSKILLDVVQSMWAASRSVVDSSTHKDRSGLPIPGQAGASTVAGTPASGQPLVQATSAKA